MSQIGRKTDGLINTGFWLGCYGLLNLSTLSLKTDHCCLLNSTGDVDSSILPGLVTIQPD